VWWKCCELATSLSFLICVASLLQPRRGRRLVLPSSLTWKPISSPTLALVFSSTITLASIIILSLTQPSLSLSLCLSSDIAGFLVYAIWSIHPLPHLSSHLQHTGLHRLYLLIRARNTTSSTPVYLSPQHRRPIDIYRNHGRRQQSRIPLRRGAKTEGGPGTQEILEEVGSLHR